LAFSPYLPCLFSPFVVAPSPCSVDFLTFLTGGISRESLSVSHHAAATASSASACSCFSPCRLFFATAAAAAAGGSSSSAATSTATARTASAAAAADAAAIICSYSFSLISLSCYRFLFFASFSFSSPHQSSSQMPHGNLAINVHLCRIFVFLLALTSCIIGLLLNVKSS
jgi:hypothetical protein